MKRLIRNLDFGMVTVIGLLAVVLVIIILFAVAPTDSERVMRGITACIDAGDFTREECIQIVTAAECGNSGLVLSMPVAPSVRP